MVLLYIKRFLQAEGITETGTIIERLRGTPQGGVISPLLANLYLHEAFDAWMKHSFPDVPFERYADDILVHCKSERHAYYMRNRIMGRLEIYKLKLHPEKTRVIYTGRNSNNDKVARKTPRKFIFLGYEFKPRMWKGKLIFSPGLGQETRKILRDKMKSWNLEGRTGLSLQQIAQEVNRTIRGWINYYGHYRRSNLYRLAHDIDTRIVRWLRKTYKLLKNYTVAWKELVSLKRAQPKLFCHWYLIASKPTRAV